MRIGSGRIHFYDQAPKIADRGNIHHFGIQTNNLEKDYQKLTADSVTLKKSITDLGYMKYVMVPAPDNVLIELFQVDKSVIPAEYHDYFA